MKKYKFPIEGITCAACVTRVEKIANKVDGISDINVNLADSSISFFSDNPLPALKVLKNNIAEYGYILHLDKPKTDISEKFFKQTKADFIVALIFTIPLFILSMLKDFGLNSEVFSKNTLNYILFFLSLPVIFYSGRRFYITALKGLKNFSFDMNTLIAVGTLSAFGLSFYHTFFISGFIYFETAGVIITLILFGKLLEENAKQKATKSIKKLLNLLPDKAVIIIDGSQKEIPSSFLKINDTILIKPGSKIPADSYVIEGAGFVDESMLTGESIPVYKEAGSIIYSGTINGNGILKATVKATHSKTILGKIIIVVEEAISSKPQVQKLVDKVAGIFTPAVIIVALISFFVWMILSNGNLDKSLIIFISVLIIACPCALGLATPTAIIVSSGISANNGILIKNNQSLEIAGKVDAVIFDKTGTLTEGKLSVSEIIPIGFNKVEMLQNLFTIESNSNHPISLAITEYCKKNNINILSSTDVEYFPGLGLKCKINGDEVISGNLKLLKENNIQSNISDILNTDNFSETKSYIAINGKLSGVLFFEDTLKLNAKAVITELKKLSIKPYLISGDSRKITERIASQIGIDDYFYEIKPVEKSDIIQQIKNGGKITAMVGDGINDAPALAKADLSFAMSSGTDVAIETADITLLKNNLSDILKTIKLSKETIRTIKQNLFWAFIYNSIGIPLAAFGMLNPMFAALAMSLSSVSVISNSLRLKRMKF